MMEEMGYCSGIENYSRHLTGRKPGEPPPTLMEYLPANALVFIDESHVTVPQIVGMYRGDRSRKETLVKYGFRLPSALDNRPLRFEEFERFAQRRIYVSATPADYEMTKARGRVVEQIIRPTGLMDPEIIVKPVTYQVDDLLGEIRKRVEKGERVLVTTLTKRMAENLTEYYESLGVRVKYLHSDIHTLERVDIIRDLRLGEFDVLVGVNLLREGLDIPEVSLVAILDADKEGFLRSEALAHPDERPGRAKRGGAGHHVRRQDHRLDAGLPRRDPAPAGDPAQVQRGERDHAGDDPQVHRQRAGLRLRGRLRQFARHGAEGRVRIHCRGSGLDRKTAGGDEGGGPGL